MKEKKAFKSSKVIMQKTGKKRSQASSKGRKKLALGKGLAALIPDMDVKQPSGSGEYFSCSIESIKANRYQPRQSFSEEELAELAGSIREQGIIQPLLVRKDGEGYELVAGERRLRAAKLAELSEVPVVIRDLSDKEMLEVSIVENIQRENFNPVEESEAYHRLISEFDLTQEQVALRVGKSRSAITNFLRLKNLPDPVKGSLRSGTISMGHARALLGAEEDRLILDAWQTVVEKTLSVRETEKLVKAIKNNGSKPDSEESAPSTYEKYLDSLSSSLTRYFKTQVKVKMRGKSGRVEIGFSSSDELDRLIKLIQKE